MSTDIVTPYRPAVPAGRDGFAQLLRAEWTKFRTVRGWVIGMVAAAIVMVLLGLFIAGSMNIACGNGPHSPTLTGRACVPPVPVGPGGEAVTDSFYFVHQPLAGNGAITVRMTSLTGQYALKPTAQVGSGGSPGSLAGARKGVQPWSKAGIIVKAGTRPGSAYAAMMVTGGHGVRMQYDFTGDTAGRPGAVSAASPRWLRLARSGDTLTGYDSADGAHWAKVGTVTLAGLPPTVQAGLFATSPHHVGASTPFGGSQDSGPSLATGVFDHVTLSSDSPSGTWTGERFGASEGPRIGQFHRAGDRFTVTGSGDIAPLVHAQRGSGYPTATIEDHLVGAFAGLAVVIVVAVMFITAEHRRGLIRTTLSASPRRGRVLAAKAIVIGLATFVAGLAAAAVTLPLGIRLSRSRGAYVFPATWLTELRVIAGTAALLAVAAVLALAVGAMLRRSAVAVTAAIAAVVLPYILGVASVLPAGAPDWLLRLTPAAAFAVQQSLPNYPQVAASYSPASGYFPLAPWAGFAVLCGYAAVAMAVAVVLLRRRDA